MHTTQSNISSAAGASDSKARHHGAAYKCFWDLTFEWFDRVKTNVGPSLEERAVVAYRDAL